MCVKMLNPTPEDYMIDTASGSCGFPVQHTIDPKCGAIKSLEEESLVYSTG